MNICYCYVIAEKATNSIILTLTKTQPHLRGIRYVIINVIKRSFLTTLAVKGFPYNKRHTTTATRTKAPQYALAYLL